MLPDAELPLLYGMRLGNSISVMLELLGHMWQSHPARLGINSKVAAQERSCFVPPAIACWVPLMPKAKGGIATIEPALSRITYKLLPKRTTFMEINILPFLGSYVRCW